MRLREVPPVIRITLPDWEGMDEVSNFTLEPSREPLTYSTAPPTAPEASLMSPIVRLEIKLGELGINIIWNSEVRGWWLPFRGELCSRLPLFG